MRLDQYAVSQYPSLSRSYITKLIEASKILVNNQPSKPGYRLKVDDEVQMNFELEELQTIEDIELPIIHEDENIIVINKPAGVISHSRGRYWYEPSVASFIRQKTGQDDDRAGIVHRLDRATSGVMICAKNQATLSFLQKQFSLRKVKKSYVAVVSGHLKQQMAIIDMPIERNPKKPQVFRVGANGKEAQTEFTVVTSYDKHDKVELKPLTGRTHQLRVHLKHIGHPIVGDELYGIEAAERLLLHAKSLEITLPRGKRETFIAPEPEIMRKFADD